MKKIFTLLVAISFVVTSFGQTIFQSNLSSWAGGNPTDWMGSKTSIAATSVVEQMVGATYGTSMAALINTSTTSHKRFTTQPVTVTPGETYLIEMWVSGLVGELRTNYYDTTNAAYGAYGTWIDLSVQSAGTLTLVTQTVTVPVTCAGAEFILSLKSTDSTGIMVDSVAISVTTPPISTPATIYQIQYTTITPFDSPYVTQLVETSGVVTGVQYNGYYLQDGNGAWNGVFVLDYTNTPTRGDSVFITGLVDEYFGYTTVKNISVYNVVTGGTLPTPTNLTTMAVSDEQYEGVLVKTTNANCILDTTSNTFREWTINDGSAALIADDKMFVYGPIISTSYDVTGIVDYSFSNFKLLPRDINDIVLSTGIDEINNVSVSIYPNPAQDQLNFELDINNFTVKIMDITGKTVIITNSITNKLNISTNNMNNGIYFYSIFNNKGNRVASSKFVVAK